MPTTKYTIYNTGIHWDNTQLTHLTWSFRTMSVPSWKIQDNHFLQTMSKRIEFDKSMIKQSFEKLSRYLSSSTLQIASLTSKYVTFSISGLHVHRLLVVLGSSRRRYVIVNVPIGCVGKLKQPALSCLIAFLRPLFYDWHQCFW